MMFTTAYGALVDIADVQAGQTVLIRAASSSVGLAAIQITKSRGAVPVALTRRSNKRDELLQHGAAHVIATEEQDLVAEVARITDGKGANVAFDPVGGSEVAKILEALGYLGIFFQYGALDNGSARGAGDAAAWQGPHRSAATSCSRSLRTQPVWKRPRTTS